MIFGVSRHPVEHSAGVPDGFVAGIDGAQFGGPVPCFGNVFGLHRHGGHSGERLFVVGVSSEHVRVLCMAAVRSRSSGAFWSL